MVEQLFLEHGAHLAYLILFFGSLVEGESFVLTAGYLAHKGFLSFPAIVVISFCGSVGADQILFFLGRHYGQPMIDRHPKWKPRADKAFRLLHKYNVWFIMGFRFIYGIRTLSPFIIGASGISIKRFAVLNVISGAFWALTSCGAGYAIGYFFSDAIEEAFHTIVHYQKLFFVALLLLVVAGVAWHFYKKRHEDKGEEGPHV